MKELQFQIALSMLPGIGHMGAKKLVAYCGGAEEVFSEKRLALEKIPGIGKIAIQSIRSAAVMEEAEQEIAFLEKNNISAHFFLDKSYPQRLLHCEDGPLILYSSGNADLNPTRSIAIVGTRNATVKGKKYLEQLVEELKAFQPCIISGLAYGIDITAHRAALKNGLQTLAVLASGLDEVYPKNHWRTARDIQSHGALISDYRSKTKLLPANFAERNRLVAGMADAVIVIESSLKGGSIITAELANGYNRDVFAVPGRPDDSQSFGCNRLIKTNRAVLLESCSDLQYILGWEQNSEAKEVQRQLFVELSEAEKNLLDAYQESSLLGLDELSLRAKMPISQSIALLLELEFKGLIQSRPGKMYEKLN